MVKKRYLNKIIDIALFFIFFLAMQVWQTNLLFENIFLPTYWYLDMLLILGLGSVCLLFKSSIFDIIYLSILYILIVIFMNVGVTFNNTVGDVFSLANIFLAAGAGDVTGSATSFNWVFSGLSIVFCALFIACLITTAYLLRVDKTEFKKQFKAGQWKKYLIGGVICASCVSGYGLTLCGIAFTNGTVDTIMLNKLANFKDYGMMSYYALEIPYIAKGISTGDTTDMVFKEYFDKPVDNKNSYSNLLEGYNVVNIMIETGDNLMMNPYLAPTFLSMLENDGINMPRNVSKNKTNMSEFIGITGSAPVSGILPTHTYEVPFAATNQLKAKGYDTLFFHDVPPSRDIYKRFKTIPEMGFDEVYLRQDMFPNGPDWQFDGSYSFDSDCFKVVSDILTSKTDKPFYAFYTTLSMHGPYVNPKNKPLLEERFGERYDTLEAEGKIVNPLKDTVNEDCVRNYMMAVMDFDEGLTTMVDQFKATKYEDGTSMYDKTLFVIYGDHEIYYKGADGVSLNKTLEGKSDMSNAVMYKTALGFVNPTLGKKFRKDVKTNQYDQLTSPYNICPTVLDLLGVNYNPNFYVGNSIFNKKEMSKPQVHYTIEQSGFFNDDFWAIKGSDVYKTFNEHADKQAFLDEVNKIIAKAAYLDTIYSNDYFVDHDFKDYNTNYQ